MTILYASMHLHFVMKPFVTADVHLPGVLTRPKCTDVRTEVVEYVASVSTISESSISPKLTQLTSIVLGFASP
jgi:hypothetical protein